MNLLEQPSVNTIAIIGGGFSGVMVAIHLLKKSNKPLKIKLIERRSTIGRGVAYGVQTDCFLLNVPTGKMSAFPDEPEHFWRWLKTQTKEAETFPPSAFVPRKFYGQYLEVAFKEAVVNSVHQFELIQDEVMDLKVLAHPKTQKARLTLKSGRTLTADKVVLALGNFPPSDPPVADRTFYASQRYIRNVWPGDILHSIAPQEPILLIGTGLTMVDVVAALRDRGHFGPIQAVSRHGLFPLPHQSTSPLPPFPLTQETRQNLRALVRKVRQQVKLASASGSDWRAVIDSLRSQTQSLWQNFPLSEQQRFLRHIRPYWDIHRHRIAPQIYDLVREMLDSHQLSIHAGRLQFYQEDDRGVNVSIRERSTGKLIGLRASVVINCTGPESNYSHCQDPLIQNLLASGEICLDPLSLGLSTNFQGEIISASGVTSSILYTLGSPRKGQLWETTAVPEIRCQAVDLARELLDSLELTS